MPGEKSGHFKVQDCNETIITAYKHYYHNFQSITQKARELFANRKRQKLQSYTVKRLELYRREVDETESLLREHLGPQISEPTLWMSAKQIYIRHIADLHDRELTETFLIPLHDESLKPCVLCQDRIYRL